MRDFLILVAINMSNKEKTNNKVEMNRGLSRISAPCGWPTINLDDSKRMNNPRVIYFFFWLIYCDYGSSPY